LGEGTGAAAVSNAALELKGLARNEFITAAEVSRFSGFARTD